MKLGYLLLFFLFTNSVIAACLQESHGICNQHSNTLTTFSNTAVTNISSYLNENYYFTNKSLKYFKKNTNGLMNSDDSETSKDEDIYHALLQEFEDTINSSLEKLKQIDAKIEKEVNDFIINDVGIKNIAFYDPNKMSEEEQKKISEKISKLKPKTPYEDPEFQKAKDAISEKLKEIEKKRAEFEKKYKGTPFEVAYRNSIILHEYMTNTFDYEAIYTQNRRISENTELSNFKDYRKGQNISQLKNHYEEAVDILEKYAKKDDIKALNIVGKAYMGFPNLAKVKLPKEKIDEKKGIEYLKSSAKMGDSFSMAVVAYMNSQEEEAAKRDDDTAIRYAIFAAQKGNHAAKTLLKDPEKNFKNAKDLEAFKVFGFFQD